MPIKSDLFFIFVWIKHNTVAFIQMKGGGRYCYLVIPTRPNVPVQYALVGIENDLCRGN